MNIRPRAGEWLPGHQQSPPTQARFARRFSCRGDARARAWSRASVLAEENSSYARCASCYHRREAAFAAVEAYNRAHPKARLPRPAARLLAVMFADQDVCCLSQQALMAEGFGDTLRRVLRALVEAGFMSKQAGTSRVPDSYRLLLPLEARP